MNRSWRMLLLLLGVLALAFLLPACSDDDPTDPGGGDDDTDAPMVAGALPGNGENGVSDSEPIIITFNEAMAETSDDGEITLSHGTITGQTWTDNRTLTVTHTDWPEATEVTVTVGTGLADVAGNNLAAPVAIAFWTESTVLAFLDSDPADGATDVNRSASVVVRFSEEMNESSLETGITISDDTKANYDFAVHEGEDGQYTLDPTVDLAENTLTTVTITVGVSSAGGQNLAEPVVFSFTTGTDVDTTPPTIVSVDPPSGSTMSPNQGSITVTFSEPMDTGTFNPSRMNMQFLMTLEQVGSDPLWNAEGTEVTVPLPNDIAAGLHLEIGFADYADANGVVQENETIWSVRVAGVPDAFPVADGQHFVLSGIWARGMLGSNIPEETGEETQYLGYSARATSGEWNLEDYTGPDFLTIQEYDIIGINSSSVSWLGFAEDDSRAKDFSEYLFTGPLVSVELPLEVGNTWDSSASVTFPDGTADAVMDGEVISYGDLPIQGSEGFDIYWSDAWRVETDLTASAGGEPFTRELRTAWYVPGVGMIRELMREEHLDPDDDPGWEESDLWLELEID